MLLTTTQTKGSRALPAAHPGDTTDALSASCPMVPREAVGLFTALTTKHNRAALTRLPLPRVQIEAPHSSSAVPGSVAAQQAGSRDAASLGPWQAHDPCSRHEFRGPSEASLGTTHPSSRLLRWLQGPESPPRKDSTSRLTLLLCQPCMDPATKSSISHCPDKTQKRKIIYDT